MLTGQIVTIICDENKQSRKFIDLVKRYYTVNLTDIDHASAEDFKKSLLIIVQVDLGNRQFIPALKEKLSLPERANVPILFLVPQLTRHALVQANILGATDYIAYPCPDNNFIQVMGDLISREVEKAWSKLSKTQEAALKVSLKVVEETFGNARRGEIISPDDIKNSCNMIIEATSKDGLTDWMNAIRQHHNYTYRHSMMVCGYLVSFGMYLGVQRHDLQQLSVGGILHDIGKSLTPLELLEKPARLTPEEWVIMKQHPSHSRTIMMESNWDDVLIDIAVHHHEKLDGSGYPDGLQGAQVSDLARMAAIADVFSGLTDKRSYKPSMSSEAAIDIMLTMEGHLDMPLVKAFRAVVL